MPGDYERTEQGDDPSGLRTERAIIEMTFGEYTKREDELLALRARVAELEAALTKIADRQMVGYEAQKIARAALSSAAQTP